MRESDKPKPLVRWSETAPPTASEAALARLFRLLPEVEPLPEAALLRARDRETRVQKGARRAASLRLAFAAMTGILGGASIAVAGAGAWSVLAEKDSSSRASVAPPDASEVSKGVVPRVRKPSAAMPAAIASEAFTPSNEPPLRALPATPVTPPSAEPGKDSASALARESELLERALIRLRKHGDARGALAEIDRYEAEFPGGILTREARVTRIDALLRIGERDRALELLKGMRLEHTGRDSELRVIRAELLSLRDPAAALKEFDTLVRVQLEPALHERALYGRAASKLALGDEASGRADLEAYQRAFPEGRFRDAVRARLAPR